MQHSKKFLGHCWWIFRIVCFVKPGNNFIKEGLSLLTFNKGMQNGIKFITDRDIYHTYKQHPYEFQTRNRSRQSALGTYDILELLCSNFSSWLTLGARGFRFRLVFILTRAKSLWNGALFLWWKAVWERLKYFQKLLVVVGFRWLQVVAGSFRCL